VTDTSPTGLLTPDKRTGLVVAPSYREGRFDSIAIDGPFVFAVDGRLGLTYLGWDGVGYQTALRWCDDGVWSEPVVIFPRVADDPIRRYNAALMSICRDNDLAGAGELKTLDGWYVGTYHAYPGAGYEAGPAVIGMCRSRDLLAWEPFGALLRPEDGPAWQQGGLYKSWLVEDGGDLYLFYNGKNRDTWPWFEQIGLATTDDFERWRRVGDAPVVPVGTGSDWDAQFASDPCVLRQGDRWVMFYYGLARDGHARDGYAVSCDLVHWAKGERVLIDVGEDGTYDSRFAHKPAVTTVDSVLHHYYVAVAPTEDFTIGGTTWAERRGIGLATGEPAV
jgi:predicted GH43/DUF377 family glycosyl hydrolase